MILLALREIDGNCMHLLWVKVGRGVQSYPIRLNRSSQRVGLRWLLHQRGKGAVPAPKQRDQHDLP